MRVELRASESNDVRARVDETLSADEIAREGTDLRVGVDAPLDDDRLRTAASLAARSLRSAGGTISWSVVEGLPITPADQVRALIEGTAYGAYDPGLFKSGYADRPQITLALEAPADLQALAERQTTVASHIDAARDLVNRPPNDLTPVALAEHAKSYAGGSLTVKSFGRDWIVGQGMGAFAAVASASAVDPQLIVMHYDPPDAGDVTLGLVGKAITFDSGGISLKPALNLQNLKGDMAGGGAVIEATAAVAELGLPVRLLTVVASTENVQGADAYKPGDILRASNGKTIEVWNTDAEGRLVLADALHYARTNGATRIIDVATLTDAMWIALGDIHGGWFCNDEEFAAEIEAASRTSGDLAWRMPLHRRYRRFIDSEYADMKNISDERLAVPGLAAEFLREFSGDGPWAHLDMAGPGMLKSKRPDYALDPGGTGYGVRLLVELAQRFAQP